METATTIERMLAGNKISVPNYQRAYSWGAEQGNSNKQQVNVFLSDLEEYKDSGTQSQYYFGHFLFEQTPKNEFGVVDGQQRLTTIIICLSALFRKLEGLRDLTEEEKHTFEDMVKRGNSFYHFSTVDYDNELFKDYVINGEKTGISKLETESAKRIVDAYDYFVLQFKDKDDAYLTSILGAIRNACCTTYTVKNESIAAQMFIFQNDRGKKPSNLEKIKAQFMFNIHLYAADADKEELMKVVKERFEHIYRSISSVNTIDEDDVLHYTLQVYFNSLGEPNNLDKINAELAKEGRIDFIKQFTLSLSDSFEHSRTFFEEEKKCIDIHELVLLGHRDIAMPFVIKAYSFGLSEESKHKLFKDLASIIFRNKLIGTRAYLPSRLNEVYRQFAKDKPDIQPITDRIDWMKKETDYYWCFWNDNELERVLQGGIHHDSAKLILWKYENHLIQDEGKGGYAPRRYDSIVKPHLEHIAPRTENGEKEASGYCPYDEEFKKEYLDCLGNYLLLSEAHNIPIGNKSFVDEKRPSYTKLLQQREIQCMTTEEKGMIWDKEKIAARKKKIIDYIMTAI
jgi:hypothetical protein